MSLPTNDLDDFEDDLDLPEESKPPPFVEHSPITPLDLDPLKPTKYAPGSPGKLLILAARFNLEMPLHLPGDNQFMDDTTHLSHLKREFPVVPESSENPLPIAPLGHKICPETGKPFFCGAHTGKCWCKEIPVVTTKPGKDCMSRPALISLALQQKKAKYSHCPECKIEFGTYSLGIGSNCPVCQKILKDPKDYEEVRIAPI